MARIRTIKPEFWTHEDLSALPEATHMLAAALLNHADDEGYFNANPGLVRAACCPLREPSVSVHDSLNLLAASGFIRLGTAADGKRYGWVVTFDDHQRVNRPTPSKIKTLGLVWDESGKAHAQLSEPSLPERNREQGKEGKGSAPAGAAAPARKRAAPTQPLPADFAISERVATWAAKKGFGRLDDHLESFRSKAKAKSYTYADWDEAFMTAIREDWAKLRQPSRGGSDVAPERQRVDL